MSPLWKRKTLEYLGLDALHNLVERIYSVLEIVGDRRSEITLPHTIWHPIDVSTAPSVFVLEHDLRLIVKYCIESISSMGFRFRHQYRTEEFGGMQWGVIIEWGLNSPTHHIYSPDKRKARVQVIERALQSTHGNHLRLYIEKEVPLAVRGLELRDRDPTYEIRVLANRSANRLGRWWYCNHAYVGHGVVDGKVMWGVFADFNRTHRYFSLGKLYGTILMLQRKGLGEDVNRIIIEMLIF